MDIPVRIAQIRTGVDGQESYRGLFRQILSTSNIAESIRRSLQHAIDHADGTSDAAD